MRVELVGALQRLARIRYLAGKSRAISDSEEHCGTAFFARDSSGRGPSVLPPPTHFRCLASDASEKMTETPSTTVRRDHLSVYIGARACLPVVLQSLIAELEGKFENNDGLAKVLARPRRRPSPRTAYNVVILAAGLLGSLRVVWRVRDPHGVEVLSFPPRGRVQAEEVSVQVGGFRFE